ncbi:MAG: hypothetical protein ACTHLW_17325 [Verrucomicrobiota bacterium]
MKNSLDLMAESIRTEQHPFRAAANRTHKPQKHRYERRKVKECIRLVDWMAT